MRKREKRGEKGQEDLDKDMEEEKEMRDSKRRRDGRENEEKDGKEKDWE